jgi:transposase-like protein
VIREAVKAVARELMELEVSELIGAEHGGRRPDDRATHRNGYRAWRWDTRAGEIELQLPKIRQGSYFPSILEPRWRSEQALLAAVQRAYVCGVSTRRVEQLVESLGLRISKSEVSRVCGALDEHVQAFRTRPLEGRYPYLFLDAQVEKVRDGDRVVNKGLVIARGVHETGRREILGLDVGESETEAFWTDFLRGLVERRLIGVQQAISGAHEHAEPDILAFYAFPSSHWRKLRSTNPLERFNKEIGRRTGVVIFPDDRSLIRLAGMLCIEQTMSGSSAEEIPALQAA